MQFSTLISVLVLAASIVAGCGGAINSHIGGTVDGLTTGTTVVLINNSNGDTVSVSYNKSDDTFTFGQSIAPNMTYNVTVLTQPKALVCRVENGVGATTATGGDVTDIKVTCEAGSGVGVPIFASVTGLGSGSVILLLNNDQLNPLTITAAGGTDKLAFPKTLIGGSAFSVTVSMQPVGQQCDVQASSGAGTVPTEGSPAPAVVICKNL